MSLSEVVPGTTVVKRAADVVSAQEELAMAWVGGGGLQGSTLEEKLERHRENSRSPWYERPPWSWLLGFLFGIAGTGVAFWLGWN